MTAKLSELIPELKNAKKERERIKKKKKNSRKEKMKMPPE